MVSKKLLQLAVHDLEDLKAVNIHSIDVHNLTTITDYMIIATGNSCRHVRAIANNLVRNMKERENVHATVENDIDDEWVLVNLGDIVVHIMQPRTRDFFNLERLWTPQEEQAMA